MAVEHFVGRQDAVRHLADLLTGLNRGGRKLAVQSIEGPGGIGKTYLFDHVVDTSNLSDRNFLTLKINGHVDDDDPSARSLVRSVARLVESAEADAIRHKPSGFYFPAVGRVIRAIEMIRNEAVEELQKQLPGNEEGRAALVRLLDLAFEAGKRLNDAVPITKKSNKILPCGVSRAACSARPGWSWSMSLLIRPCRNLCASAPVTPSTPRSFK